ncbi:MAG: hypothetical protein Q9195_007428 [Heterodermia aff. obscurata]
MPMDSGAVTRQRGRPRLEARDQTAGDRRRTQIRLAQRAYRQRKESNITELNDQVASLERTIGEMNQTISSFEESALASGMEEMSPILAQDLRAIVKRFNDIAQVTKLTSMPPKPNTGMDLSARMYDLENSIQETRTVQNIAARDRIDMFTPGSEPKHQSKAATQIWGYEVGEEGVAAEHNEEQTIQPVKELYGNLDVSADFDWLAQNTTQLHHAQMTEEDPEAQSIESHFSQSLTPPSTYSFQESTFARRLARAAYERAYRMLTSPNSRREDIDAMCKFSFCFSNLKAITAWVSSIHKKGKDESLELWQAPQLHIGDAGLHYPRELEAHVPAYWANKAPMGPRRSTQAETPVPDWMTVDQIIEMTGYQGEWFDPHDVEQYLRAKGLQLDGLSTWLELDVNEVPALESHQLNASASPAESYPEIDPSSPVNIEAHYLGEPIVHAAERPCQSAILPDAPYMDPDTAFIESLLNSTSPVSKVPDEAGRMFTGVLAALKPSVKKVFDVEKFIDRERWPLTAEQGMTS